MMRVERKNEEQHEITRYQTKSFILDIVASSNPPSLFQRLHTTLSFSIMLSEKLIAFRTTAICRFTWIGKWKSLVEVILRSNFVRSFCRYGLKNRTRGCCSNFSDQNRISVCAGNSCLSENAAMKSKALN